MEDEKQQEVEKVLSEEILADARRRAERTVKRAEREGQKLVDDVVKRAEAVRRRVLERGKRRVEREQQMADSALALDERMCRLKGQGVLLDEVFTRAMTRLVEGRQPDYKAVVTELAVEGVLAMTGDEFVLHLGEKDLSSIKRGLCAEVSEAVRERSGRTVQLHIADAAAPIDAGVMVEGADGRQRFDNSFAGRLQRMKGELRFEVAQFILGAGDETQGAAGEGQP